MNESPYFCCGWLPSEGHTKACTDRNGENEPNTWCDTCSSWRYTVPCGRDDCPHDKTITLSDLKG